MTLDPGTTVRITTRDDVIRLYQQYLGRPPENEGAIVGRVGLPYAEVEAGIANSTEAIMVARARREAQETERETRRGQVRITTPAEDDLLAKVRAALDQIGSVKDDLTSDAWRSALEAAQSVFQVADDIRRQLDEQTRTIAQPIGKIVDAVTKQLTTMASGLLPSTLTLMGAALGGVETLLSTFLANSADLSDIGDLIEALGKGNAPDIAGWLINTFVLGDQNIASEIGKKIGDALMPDGEALPSSIAAVSGFLPTPVEVDV